MPTYPAQHPQHQHHHHQHQHHQQRQQQQQQQEPVPQPYSPGQKYTSYAGNSHIPADAQAQLGQRYQGSDYQHDKKYGGTYARGDYKDFRPPSYASAHASQKGVQEVDQNGFQRHVKDQGQPTVVAFVAEGCGHCTALKPNFAEAATLARLPFLQVEYAQAGDLCKALGINGFPTILRFEGGEKVAEYRGDRSADSLAKFGS
ncbi:MAG TPA: protein disulfide isomerase family protein [Candidatus Obscuribacterales bacterium]